MPESEHFINRGYGWTCKRCDEEPTARAPARAERARFFHEGEAEQIDPAPALARWRDATHQTLVCPRCGLEERMKDETT